jgi:2-amino-4-hydroxy-6-hydroxymethyldihydropteridine diphosphokinase
LIAYLGLGSNVGDRLAKLSAAVGWLEARQETSVTARSSVYETEPVGEFPDQRDFYNAAVRIETTLGPHALLDLCKRAERELGREPGGPRHGPRPIDVDLLLADELELRDGALSVPHPALTERRFVLVPLLEIDPGLALPDGRPLAAALRSLRPGQRVVKVARLGPAAESAG